MYWFIRSGFSKNEIFSRCCFFFPLPPQKTDVTNELVDDLINKTKEYLQPNPGELHSSCRLTSIDLLYDLYENDINWF